MRGVLGALGLVLALVGGTRADEPPAGLFEDPGVPAGAAPKPGPSSSWRPRLLDVQSEPSGAVVIIDGATVGTAPLRAFPVGPGDHVVEARWSDGTWAVVGVRLRPRSSRTVTLRRIE